MPGPWEKYGGAASASQPMTVGAPDPYKRQERQQDITKGGLDIDGKRLDIEAKKLEVEKLRAGTEAGKFGVEQGKAAGFYQRAIKANQFYDGLKIGAPTLGREVAKSILPSGIVNTNTGADRQQAEAAQDDFIASTLRYESGAAIPPEEMDAQRRRYFPVAGDDPETIKLKAQLRQTAISALQSSAGGAAGNFTPPPQDEDQITTELQNRLRAGGDPADTIEWLVGLGRRPDKATIQAIIAASGKPNAQALPPEPSPLGQSFMTGVGDVVEGVGDIGGLVVNPFTTLVNSVAGTNIRPDLGQNMRDGLGLPEAQNGQGQVASAITQTATGGAGFGGVVRGVAQRIPGVVQNALARFSNPVTDIVSGGAAGGASDLTRQAGGGPVLQGAAALAGGVGGGMAGNRMNALMTRPAPVETALTRAGQQEGVTVRRAMADPDAQTKLTAVGKTMVGGKMMQREMGQVGDQIEGRVKRLGQDGTPLEPSVAGQTVQGALQRSIKHSGQRLGRIYDGLVRETGDLKVPPAKSAAIIDEMIGKLGETKGLNSAELTFLKELKKDFGKDLSVSALRDARTTLRKKIGKGDLVFGQNEKRILDIMDAAADDVASGLTAAGKRGAALKFKQVDAQYRSRMEFIKGTVQKVVGKRDANYPPEQIIANLKSMATPKGNSEGLGKILREMDPDERQDIAATFADALGKNSDGQFSTAFLVKHIDKIPPAARAQVFGEEGAKSLENLKVLAQQHKRVMGALGGSQTGVANDLRSYMMNFVLGGGAGGSALISGGTPSSAVLTGAAVGATGYGIKAGRDALSARLLMSKDFQNWLRTTPKTTSGKAINQHLGRLTSISSRHPALSEEISRFSKALNDNIGATAAADPNER